MFTQMVVDQNQEKVYIYDREEFSDEPDCDKLQTIMEGGSDVSSRLIDGSRVQSYYNSESVNRKLSIDSKYNSRATDNSQFRPKISLESNDVPVVRGVSHFTCEEDRDEVLFCFDSAEDRKQCKQVYLRSNSVSSRDSSTNSPDTKREPSTLQRSYSEQKMKSQYENSIMTSNSNSTEKEKRRKSITDEIIKDYVIIEKNVRSNPRFNNCNGPNVHKRSQSPCLNIDEDEITVVEFTKSNFMESVTDSECEVKGRESKTTKQLQRWESRVLLNYGVKQVSVDLSNTITEEDGTKYSSSDVVQIVSRQPSSEELPEVNQPNNLSKYAGIGSYQSPVSTAPNTSDNVTQSKRIQRLLKDSMGSTWNHQETLEEFNTRLVGETIVEVPQRHKPNLTKISMLSGDLEKPKIKLDTQVRKSNGMKERPGYIAHKVNRSQGPINHSLKKSDPIRIENSDYMKLQGRHQSPRTRNDVYTAMSTHQLNTCETRLQNESKFRSYRDCETSPLASRYKSSDMNPYNNTNSEYYRSDGKNYDRRDLSRSPSIGPVKRAMSPKVGAKIIVVPLRSPDVKESKKRIKMQSSKCGSSTSKLPKINYSASKEYLSRNIEVVSPLRYDTQASPCSKIYQYEDIMEMDKSVRKIQSYKDKITLLSTQNKKMATVISHLQEELKRAQSKERDNQVKACLSLKKIPVYNKTENDNSPCSYMTKEKNVDCKQRNSPSQNSVRKHRIRRDHCPLLSIDTNAETLKLSTSISRTVRGSQKRTYRNSRY